LPHNGAADERKNEALNASLASYLTLIFGGQSVVGRAASAAETSAAPLPLRANGQRATPEITRLRAGKTTCNGNAPPQAQPTSKKRRLAIRVH